VLRLPVEFDRDSSLLSRILQPQFDHDLLVIKNIDARTGERVDHD